MKEQPIRDYLIQRFHPLRNPLSHKLPETAGKTSGKAHLLASPVLILSFGHSQWTSKWALLKPVRANPKQDLVRSRIYQGEHSSKAQSI